jgi:hypothetical protein
MHLLMGAQTVGAEILTIGAAVDGECAIVMVKADQIFFLDLIRSACADPVRHGASPYSAAISGRW